jgi:hypothetical protein
LVNALWLSAAIAWPVVAGDPQFAYVLGLACGLYGLVHLSRGRRKRGGYFLLALPAAGLAGAVQALPALAGLSAYTRVAGGVSLKEAEWFSFHPARLLEWLIPFPFGSFRPGNTYWGQGFTEEIMIQPVV